VGKGVVDVGLVDELEEGDLEMPEYLVTDHVDVGARDGEPIGPIETGELAKTEE